eukprot:TRINITY_DN4024_c0_g1_i3.p1 TRINITY_DN4024_c0_g1~~TRINITY_DN4024_c0_g1_i3.p1  ORF type:complete len:1897 (+),score=413.12 TRINITY_DN4024_c0_g1_i3:105-5693(+)
MRGGSGGRAAGRLLAATLSGRLALAQLRVCFKQTEANAECMTAVSQNNAWGLSTCFFFGANLCSNMCSGPSNHASGQGDWSIGFSDRTDDKRTGGCSYQWRATGAPAPLTVYRLCFREVEGTQPYPGSPECGGNRSSCTAWGDSDSWTEPFEDMTQGGPLGNVTIPALMNQGCTYKWKIEEKVSSALSATRCRVKFQETSGNRKACTGSRDSVSGWSDKSNPAWTSSFHDNTNLANGFCSYRWGLECDYSTPDPTAAPSAVPTAAPTVHSPPSPAPSTPPTAPPVAGQTGSPSSTPSEAPETPPTGAPSALPSRAPAVPSQMPTHQPFTLPTGGPSANPTRAPQSSPTVEPTSAPSVRPSLPPSLNPTAPPLAPSVSPSSRPTVAPTLSPSIQADPTSSPSPNPTRSPVPGQTGEPSVPPSAAPSLAPSSPPTATPTAAPSGAPSLPPSTAPTDPPLGPTARPSRPPSPAPTPAPSRLPTSAPTPPAPSAPPSRPPTAPPIRLTLPPYPLPTRAPGGAPTALPTAQPAPPPAAPTGAPSEGPTKREETGRPRSCRPPWQPSCDDCIVHRYGPACEWSCPAPGGEVCGGHGHCNGTGRCSDGCADGTAGSGQCSCLEGYEGEHCTSITTMAAAGVATTSVAVGSLLIEVAAGGTVASSLSSVTAMQLIVLIGTQPCAPGEVQAAASQVTWVLNPFYGALESPPSAEADAQHAWQSLKMLLGTAAIHCGIVGVVYGIAGPTREWSLTDAMEFTLFPNLLILAVGLFLLNSVSSSTTVLISAGHGPLDRCVAALLLLAYFVGLPLLLRHFYAFARLNARADDPLRRAEYLARNVGNSAANARRVVLTEKRQQFMPRALVYFLPSGFWTSLHLARRGFCRRFNVIYDEYRAAKHWYMMVQLWKLNAYAMLTGLRVDCTVRLVLLLAAAAVFGVVLVWQRPYASRGSNVLHSVVAASTVAIIATCLVGAYVAPFLLFNTVALITCSLWTSLVFILGKTVYKVKHEREGRRPDAVATAPGHPPSAPKSPLKKDAPDPFAAWENPPDTEKQEEAPDPFAAWEQPATTPAAPPPKEPPDPFAAYEVPASQQSADPFAAWEVAKEPTSPLAPATRLQSSFAAAKPTRKSSPPLLPPPPGAAKKGLIQLPAEEASHVGQLFVRGPGDSGFAERWAEVRGGALVIFADSGSPNPLAAVELSGCTAKRAGAAPVPCAGPSADTMALSGGEGCPLLLRSDDIDGWLAAIGDVARGVTVGEGPQLSSAKLDDWVELEVLGTGAFGEVRRCRRVGTQAPHFALKKVKVGTDEAEVMSEIAILQLLCHPLVVRLEDAFTDGPLVCLVLQLLPGGDLSKHIKDLGRISADATKFYAVEVALALEHLHANKILYRDLKPANVVLDSHWHAVLTDMGIAHRGLVSGEFCGTPYYLAPEVIAHRTYNERVDWWAFGVVIFEMLAGFTPFAGSDPQVTFQLIKMKSPSYPVHFPVLAQQLIGKLLRKNPKDRLCQPRRVIKHPWFRGLDAGKMISRKVTPPRMDGELSTVGVSEHASMASFYVPRPEGRSEDSSPFGRPQLDEPLVAADTASDALMEDIAGFSPGSSPNTSVAGQGHSPKSASRGQHPLLRSTRHASAVMGSKRTSSEVDPMIKSYRTSQPGELAAAISAQIAQSIDEPCPVQQLPSGRGRPQCAAAGGGVVSPGGRRRVAGHRSTVFTTTTSVRTPLQPLDVGSDSPSPQAQQRPLDSPKTLARAGPSFPAPTRAQSGDIHGQFGALNQSLQSCATVQFLEQSLPLGAPQQSQLASKRRQKGPSRRAYVRSMPPPDGPQAGPAAAAPPPTPSTVGRSHAQSVKSPARGQGARLQRTTTAGPRRAQPGKVASV